MVLDKFGSMNIYDVSIDINFSYEMLEIWEFIIFLYFLMLKFFYVKYYVNIWFRRLKV